MNKTSVFVLKSYLNYELSLNLRNKTKRENIPLHWLNYANKNNPTLFLRITVKKKILKLDVKKGMEETEKQSRYVWFAVMNPRGSWAES
jgi:hypothetical protein